MGKTRDLFKKMRDTKGTFLAKMTTIKDRNGNGPNRSRRCEEEVARRQRRTYKKDLHDPDNHDGVITHLEPDILECDQVGFRKHHYEQS